MRRAALIFLFAITMLGGGCLNIGDEDSSTNSTATTTETNSNVEESSTDVKPEKSEEKEKEKTEEETDKKTESSSKNDSENQPTPTEPVSNNESRDKEDSTKSDSPVENIWEEISTDKYFLPMAGIIAVLSILSAWLAYDRHKRKSKFSPNLPKNSPTDTVTLNTTTESFVPADSMKIRVGNLHNIGKRDEQQDSFCLSDINDEKSLREKGMLAVVADGMGGMKGGATISQTITDIFRKKYLRTVAITNPAAFLYETALEAENAVDAYMNRTGVEGGSTLVAVLLKNSAMHFISVGDSHIYLLQGQNLKQINHEHNYGELLKEKAAKGEVAPNEPYVNPRRHALTAYIGKGNLNMVDQNENPILINPGDKIFLCSDGVYNALGDDALVAALEGDALIAAQNIEQSILRQNLPKQDNFTGIVLECVK